MNDLQTEEVLTLEDINTVRTSYKSKLEAELAKMASYVPSASMLEKQWAGVVWPASAEAQHDPSTGVEKEKLEKIGKASVAVPEGFVRFLSR